MPLSPEQQAVVDAPDPVIAVLAGAGSGKTATIVAKIKASVASGVDPSRVLAITFTHKAADELTERLRAVDVEGVEASTIHGWCAKVLRTWPELVSRTAQFVIYDEDDREAVVRDCAMRLAVKGAATSAPDVLLRTPAVRLRYEDALRAGDAFDFEALEATTIALIERSPEVRVWLASRYNLVIIDEHQDTSIAQVALTRALAPIQFLLVGDLRQAIYRFRGADPSHFAAHAASANVRALSLSTCYRSIPKIVDVANHVMAHMEPLRSGRTVPYQGHHGVTEGSATYWFAPGIDSGAAFGVRALLDTMGHDRPGDVAVLCRTWATAEAATAAIKAAGVPVKCYAPEEDEWTSPGGKMLERGLRALLPGGGDHAVALFAATVDGGRSYRDLRTIATESGMRLVDALTIRSNDPEAWRAFSRLADEVRSAEYPPDAIRCAERLVETFGMVDKFEVLGLTNRRDAIESLLGFLRKRRGWTLQAFSTWWSRRSVQDRIDRTANHVHVLTVHGAKGLEWPGVVVMDAVDGVYPGRRSVTPDEIEDDRRLLYVALTRARDHVVFVAHETEVPKWGAPRSLVPSPMLHGPWMRMPGMSA